MFTLSDLFQTSATRHVSRPALKWGEQTWTYGQLNDDVDRLAKHFPRDEAAGQRVGVLAANTPCLILGMLAAWRSGAVAVPLNARLRTYELRQILADARLWGMISVEAHQRFSFTELLSELLPTLPTLQWCLLVEAAGKVREKIDGPARETPEPLGPEIAVILYTSGTTGTPKGVLMTHQTGLAAAPAINTVLEATGEDVCLLVIPISHAFGLTMFLAHLAAGGLAVLIESTFSMGPVASVMRQCRPTLLHGSPTFFESLLRSFPQDVSTVRTGLVGGSVCTSAILQRLDEMGVNILNSYGMTEFGPATSCVKTDPPSVRHASVGRPLPGFALRIAGGQLQVKSPLVTPGYFGQPELTAAALDDGWFRTGDLGSIDQLGYLYIHGRAKEVIHVAGLKVFPAEVEGCLMTHPDVLQAVVVGAPHDTMGEVPQAFVVPRPNSRLSTADLLQFGRRHMAGYKLPYLIHLVPDLPLLATGKPDRAALARSVVETQYADAGTRA